MELWGDRLAGASSHRQWPTALFRLLEMLDAGAPPPRRDRPAVGSSARWNPRSAGGRRTLRS